MLDVVGAAIVSRREIADAGGRRSIPMITRSIPFCTRSMPFARWREIDGRHCLRQKVHLQSQREQMGTAVGLPCFRAIPVGHAPMRRSRGVERHADTAKLADS